MAPRASVTSSSWRAAPSACARRFRACSTAPSASERASFLVEAGVVVVDKPRGMTSHDVVAKARRALGTRQIGHAGTLDPIATGVLVLAVGQATKLVAYLSAADKEYEAAIALGATTDTLDADGRVTERAPLPDDWRSRLDEAL